MKTRLAISGVLGALAFAGVASGAQNLRVQVNQRGDIAAIGNTLGHHCSFLTPAPVVGTLGACGFNTGDSAPDVFWQSEQPANGATASTAITLAQSRSTAFLDLPTGATVTHAFLYWGARKPGAGGDSTVTLDRPGGASATVTAANIYTLAVGTQTVYESVADVTSIVQTQGEGTYRVAGVDATNFVNLNEEVTFSAWSLVVLYDLSTEPLRNLAVFDGLDGISSGNPSNVTLAGFLVPNAGFDAKLLAVTYEGDDQNTGDSLLFGTAPLGAANRLSDAVNPIDNFFNSSRSRLGAPVSVVGDLPQLTGGARSMSSFDLDIVDVTSRLTAGQTTVDIRATTNQDVYYLGAFATSISTFRPEFDTSSKGVVDVNGGLVRPGDVLEYSVLIANTGNDAAVGVVMTDPIPAGVTYVPGSTTIDTVSRTDQAGDDVVTFDGPSRTLTARLGTGANAAVGGTMAIGATVTVRFRVTVDANASGRISNQATITAAGQRGAPPATTPTDGNGGDPGQPPTEVDIQDCLDNADCASPTPFCNTAPDPNVCVECLGDAQCPSTAPACDPATNTCGPCTSDTQCPSALPVCLPSGSCGECTPANDAACTSQDPVCNPATNTCVGCVDSGDCSGTLPFCNTTINTCVPCANDTQCPGGAPACQPDGSCGQCSATNDALCTGATPVCDALSGTCVPGCNDDADCPSGLPRCDVPNSTCVECLTAGDCGSAAPLCDPASDTCVGCLTDTDCAGTTPVCNPGTQVCGPCTANADCPSGLPVCLPSGGCGECSATDPGACATDEVCDTATAVCVGCVDDGDCSGTTPVCSGVTRTCVPCTSDAQCPGGAPACQPDGSCNECSATNDAACTGATPVCDTQAGTCTSGCNDDTDCPVATPVCDVPNNVCVGCLVNDDCGGATPVCSPTARECVGCVTSTNCSGATPVCDPATETCVGCVDDTDCPGTAPSCAGSVCVCPGTPESCRDTDGDGLTDDIETAVGTDLNDADTDDDGVPDGQEPDFDRDTDGDGLINALDPDSDNDGLFDGTELGLGCSGAQTDAAAGHCRPDGDQGATRTDPLLADTDGGGVSDGSEDFDLDGAPDARETNPTAGSGADDANVVDTDGDGLSDGLEDFLGSDPDDADSDDDGLPDGEEANPSDDTDGDGLVNVLDVDSDNDGLFDGTETGRGCEGNGTAPGSTHCIADADLGVTTTSMVIADTDRGGVRDGSEDSNRNGVVDTGETDPTVGNAVDDGTVVDTDGDGLSDDLEDTLGSDPNDADSDDDGVPDGEEANPGDDGDGDGARDVMDRDSDGDGIFDGTETGRDCSLPATAVAAGNCVPDADPTTTTSMVDPDTDRGGVRDGDEDLDHDGAVDTGETDPNDPTDDSTADGGAPDAGGDAGAADAGAEAGVADAGDGAAGSPGTGGAGAGGAGAGGVLISSGGAPVATGGATPAAGGAAAATPDAGTIQGGGCACRVEPRASSGASPWAALVALGVAVGLRHRGRRRRAA